MQLLGTHGGVWNKSLILNFNNEHDEQICEWGWNGGDRSITTEIFGKWPQTHILNVAENSIEW